MTVPIDIMQQHEIAATVQEWFPETEDLSYVMEVLIAEAAVLIISAIERCDRDQVRLRRHMFNDDTLPIKLQFL